MRGATRRIAMGCALAACSSYGDAPSVSQPDGGIVGESDGAVPTDGGLSVDANDEAAASFDSGLLTNGSFEMTGVGCGPGWNAINSATAEISSTAHSGANGCKVCTAQPGMQILRAQLPGAAGSTYGLQAYFHAAGDASPPQAYEFLSFQLSNKNYAGGGAEKIFPLLDGWSAVAVSATMPDAAVTVTVDVGLDVPDGGGCIVVDDVTLVRQ